VSASTVARAATRASRLDEIFKSVARSDGPGLVVGVAQHGEVLLRRGLGLASIEHGTANTPRTRMRLASVTKHFTCFATLLLAEDGKLDIDVPATAVLPELMTLSGVPTLRQLMNHTGGYHCFMELFYMGSGMAWQPPGAGLALQLRQTGVSFAPGASQLYCNGGYELLSEAIARASGMSFERFLKERIFEPLGMRDTECVPSDMQIVPGLATFHVPAPDGSWRRGITPMDDNRGAGAIVSTVDDMLRWLSHLRGPGRVVGSEASWREMTTVARLDNGLATSYALGLYRHDHRGVEVIHHGGSLVGAGSQMVTVPAHGLDIIVMTNGALVNPVQMSWDIVDVLLAGHLAGKPPAMATSARFAHLFGTRYHAPSGMLYGFGAVGEQLGLSILNSPYAPILRDRGEVVGFRSEEAGLGPIEIRVADMAAAADGSAPAVLPIAEAGNVERYRLLPARPPATARVGRALVGRYRCEDLNADAQIAFEQDALVLRIFAQQGTRVAALTAFSNSVFGATATDPQAPAFWAITVQRKASTVVGVWLSTARARRLWFERLSEQSGEAG
jgi:CubicO group peptidase (beta-lactamase class C family)